MIDGSDDDNALDDGAPDSPQSDENLDDIDGDTAVRPPQPSPFDSPQGKTRRHEQREKDQLGSARAPRSRRTERRFGG